MEYKQQVLSPAFTYADRFDKLIREPHRRSATACRAPGLVWHFGFWPVRDHDPQDARTRGDFNNRLINWVEGQLAPFVSRLHAAGSSGYMGSPPNFSVRNREENGKNEFDRMGSFIFAGQFRVRRPDPQQLQPAQ